MNFYSIGFFGGPNFGDELLCKCIVNRLRETYPNSTIFLMTRNEDVSRRYTGTEAEYVKGYWPDPEYFLNLGQHLRAVTNSSVVVIGGGGLIADYYSWTGIPCYCIDALWAILTGRRYVFLGLGVRKIRRRWLRSLARFVCRGAAALYCRDQGSSEELKKLTGREDIRVGPDLANMGSGELCGEYEEKDYVLVNFRERPRIDEEKVTALCRELLKDAGQLVLLSAERPDTYYYKRIVENWDSKEQAATKLVEPKSLNEAVRWIREAKFVAAERLHVNILAAHAGKRLLTINYEEKVKQFVEMLEDKPLICSLEQVGAEQARRLLALKVPGWSERLTKLQEQTKETFDETIRVGLCSGSYRFRERFAAASCLMGLLVFGVLWSVAIIVKRAIFGRGPLPWFR